MQSPSLSPSTTTTTGSSSSSMLLVVVSHVFHTTPLRRWFLSDHHINKNDTDTLSSSSSSELPLLVPTPPYAVVSLWNALRQYLPVVSSSFASSLESENENENEDDTDMTQEIVSSSFLMMMLMMMGQVVVALLLAIGLHTTIVTLTNNNHHHNHNNEKKKKNSTKHAEHHVSPPPDAILMNGDHAPSTSTSSSSSSLPTHSTLWHSPFVAAAVLPWQEFVTWTTSSILWRNCYVALQVYVACFTMGLLGVGLPLPQQQQQQQHRDNNSNIYNILSAIVTNWLPRLHNRYSTTDMYSSSSSSNSSGIAADSFNTTTIGGGSSGSSTLAAAAASTTTTSSLLSGTAGIFRFQDAAPMVALMVWMATTMSAIKRQVLLPLPVATRMPRITNNNNNNNTDTSVPTSNTTTTAATPSLVPPPKMSGRMILLNRIMDIVIYGILAVAILHEISTDHATFYVLVSSLVSAGGIGALILSLASKDLAVELVGGMTLGVYDLFHVGDRVRIPESNLSGKVLEIGVVETMIQSYDNIITRVPNSQITKSRISNLSRCPRSRLRQNIRIKYSDIDKLPALLIDIREEIIISCPKVISDGSKSFHTVISSFEADHIQVMILAHFEIPPVTAEYIRNRHDVLLAIHRAMKKHQVDFAIPPIVYTSGNYAPSPTNARDPADYSL